MSEVNRVSLKEKTYPIPAFPFIICDIDGTIADNQARAMLHLHRPGQKKDWKGWFDGIGDDPPRQEIIEIVRGHHEGGHPIVFMTGRHDGVRTASEEWLERHWALPYVTLLMRGDGDRRPDTIVKRELYEVYLQHYPIKLVIDDRPSVVRMWGEVGLEVLDVGSGVEF